jgi:hypothetical protein
MKYDMLGERAVSRENPKDAIDLPASERVSTKNGTSNWSTLTQADKAQLDRIEAKLDKLIEENK